MSLTQQRVVFWENRHRAAEAVLKETLDKLAFAQAALRQMRLDAAGILDPENKPGYELREYAEQIHAMTDAAMKRL